MLEVERTRVNVAKDDRVFRVENGGMNIQFEQ